MRWCHGMWHDNMKISDPREEVWTNTHTSFTQNKTIYNMYCCWNCFFSTNTCGSNPRTVTNPKTTRVFIPPSWTLSCSRNSKRASLLISSWSNHWVTSGNRKLKNLGPEAMGWIDDGSLMVVDGRFCRIFSHGRSWKSRIFGWPLVSLLSPMEVLPVICQQKAFLPNEAGLGHELVT